MGGSSMKKLWCWDWKLLLQCHPALEEQLEPESWLWDFQPFAVADKWTKNLKDVVYSGYRTRGWETEVIEGEQGRRRGWLGAWSVVSPWPMFYNDIVGRQWVRGHCVLLSSHVNKSLPKLMLFFCLLFLPIYHLTSWFLLCFLFLFHLQVTWLSISLLSLFKLPPGDKWSVI